MQEIARMTDHMVEQAKNYNSTTIPGDYASLRTPCPRCGGLVRENYRRFACEGCEFSISKVPGGRTFEVEEVETLLRERQLGPMDGFRSKMGRPFAASLRLTSEHKLEFDFGQGSAEGDAEEVDFSGQTSLGPCPKCGSAVFLHGSSYVCEKSVGPSKTCDFRSGLMILQQSIAAEQMQKLLNEGRTTLLDGFVSARTKRRFKAYLVKTDEGKVGFEFEAKKPKAPGAKVATKTSKVAKSKIK
jgi:DNA topoisomerase-3